MLKKPILFIILVATLSFSVVIPVAHSAIPEAVDAISKKEVGNEPCTFTSAAGLLKDGKVFTATGGCSPTDLMDYMNALNTFFYRLAIVLAVLMITIGGMQWLMAIGNAGKIGRAKDTIQDAVIGLILALVAILLFNQIDSSFTELNLDRLISLGTKEDTSCTTRKTPSECLFRSNCAWVPKGNGENYFDGDCKEGASLYAPIQGNYEFKHPDRNLAAKEMIIPLRELANSVTGASTGLTFGKPLRITEAYPVTPGVGHETGKHSTGCAVDVTPPLAAKDIPAGRIGSYCDVVTRIINDARRYGLTPLNEDSACGGTPSPNSTGGHVHLSLSACPLPNK